MIEEKFEMDYKGSILLRIRDKGVDINIRIN